ncbi:dihydroorotase [Sphingomonas sanxanigenens]|uniref:Amidohydrolase-related domain-containing protein n=1 Tax=Sphingomonas sanxanigenens DSM 19645 = NX02 TaxID=1123269 RepID=W0A460_9SPHN|nr:amidohydrolase family protein [Sphingomonas sanxanigenens]AHE52744.1 hypothetical protein NX02_05015 [Sphingomonas sanxanigenens DSM 19645 = NX02]
MGLTTSRAILNARIVDPEGGVSQGGVLIRDGSIAAVGAIDVPAGLEVLDARGAMVAPGIVDLGIFAIDLPAMRAGGITRAGLMPDQAPPLDGPGLVQRAAAAGKPDLWIHPIAAATRALEGRELAEYGLMKTAGARAVSSGRTWIADSAIMLRALRYAAAHDLVFIAHAEDGGLTGGAVATAGETATRLGLPSAPAIAEAIAIARDLWLAREAECPIHFRQVTTAAGFDLIRAAKAAGQKVSCGIGPAHLHLSDIAVSDFRTFAHLSPPLRDEADRQAALAAVADGTIDVLCSAHDPRGPEDKRLPFADSAPGMAGAETLLPMGLALVRDGLIAIERLFRLLSTNPAQLLGVEGGVLREGAAADLILFDPETPWLVDTNRLAATAGNTPFDGLPVQGKVLRMIKGGQLFD